MPSTGCDCRPDPLPNSIYFEDPYGMSQMIGCNPHTTEDFNKVVGSKAREIVASLMRMGLDKHVVERVFVNLGGPKLPSDLSPTSRHNALLRGALEQTRRTLDSLLARGCINIEEGDEEMLESYRREAGRYREAILKAVSFYLGRQMTVNGPLTTVFGEYLGSGSAGDVFTQYYALGPNKERYKEDAVKVHRPSKQGQRFLRGCPAELIPHIQNATRNSPHLATFIGSCFAPWYQGYRVRRLDIIKKLDNARMLQDLIDDDEYDIGTPAKFALFLEHIFMKILVGIKAFHDYRHADAPNGIVFCDMKPENVLWLPNSSFDITTYNPQQDLVQVVDYDSVHLSGTLLTHGSGTKEFLSPEQQLAVEGAEINLTCQSDVYSLGLMLQEIWIRKVLSQERNMPQWVDLKRLINQSIIAEPQFRINIDNFIDNLKQLIIALKATK